MCAKKRSRRRRVVPITQPNEKWQRLVEEFPRHPALKSGTIYALPPRLIDAIRREARGFFSEDELRFEQAVSASGQTGYFGKVPFRSRLLDDFGSEGSSSAFEIDEQQAENDRLVDEMQDLDLRSRGRTPREIQEYKGAQDRMRRLVMHRKRAYAGWLISDPFFRWTRDRLRKRWKSRFEAAGLERSFPKSFLGERREVARKDVSFQVAIQSFFQHWGLDTLETWEIPIPLDAEILQKPCYAPEGLGAAGLTIFLPWYLLRDKTLKLHEIAETQRLGKPKRHLDPWLNRNEENLGKDRFGMFLPIYVYRTLALESRYPDRLLGRTRELDRALGQFIHKVSPDVDRGISVEETIRKIRQKLAVRLKQVYRPPS